LVVTLPNLGTREDKWSASHSYRSEPGEITRGTQWAGEIFRARSERPRIPHSLPGHFTPSGVKWPEHGAKHSLPCTAEVVNGLKLYFHLPLRQNRHVMGWLRERGCTLWRKVSNLSSCRNPNTLSSIPNEHSKYIKF